MNKNLLVSLEEYSKTRHEFPYFYSLKSDNKLLYYFGSKHTMDYDHPQFILLHEKFKDFLHKKVSDKVIVFFEGRVNPAKLITLNESIKKYCESGAIVFWSNEMNIPSFRPEPTIEYEVSQLIKDFSKEEIFCFYIIRRIIFLQRSIVEQNIAELIESAVKEYKTILNWSDFDFSFENFKNIYKKIFNKDLDLSDSGFLKKNISSLSFESRINDVDRTSSKIRNFYILDQIEKYWKDDYNIFIVYGGSHAVMQEPVLKSLVL